MIFRPYRQEDQEQIIRLHLAGLDQYGANAGIGPWDDDLIDIQETYMNNHGYFLVCLENNKIIGMGAIKKHTEEIAEIKRMRVSKEYQGKGIGKIILNELEERALEKGYKKLILDTTVNHVPAQKLYRKSGYIETKRELLAGFETIFFEKSLRRVKENE